VISLKIAFPAKYLREYIRFGRHVNEIADAAQGNREGLDGFVGPAVAYTDTEMSNAK
jgi:hypothetical protein